MNDRSFAERSVDERMDREMTAGAASLGGDAATIAAVNQGISLLSWSRIVPSLECIASLRLFPFLKTSYLIERLLTNPAVRNLIFHRRALRISGASWSAS